MESSMLARLTLQKYEVIYGHAWVNQKTRTADGQQIIQMNIQRRRTEQGLL